VRVVMLNIWLGPAPLPAWLPQLIANRNAVGAPFEWWILTDVPSPPANTGSVRFVVTSRAEIRMRVRQHLGAELALGASGDHRKITEVRPMMGLLFGDIIGDADFWGYFDLDTVLGRLSAFYPAQVLALYDVLAANVWVTEGPLTIVRNNDLCNNLWRAGHDVLQRLAVPGRIFSHDEIMFGKVVWDAWMRGEIHAHFGHRFTHDSEQAAVELRPGGVLYDRARGDGGKYCREHRGREVIGHHFARTKRWPLSCTENL